MAVVALLFLVVWELTDDHPVVDLSLFKSRNFTIGCLCISLAYMLYFGAIVLLPQLLQEVYGYTATWAGLASGQVSLVAEDTTGVYLPDTMVVTVVSTIEFREIGSFSRQANFYVNNNQTHRAQVFLSDPAPPGGLGVTFVYGVPGKSVIAPSPAVIPAGQLAADVAKVSDQISARSRILVERSALDRFMAALEEAVEGIRVGDPLDESTEMGPLISADQRETVASYANGEAPVAIRGSAPEGKGFWFPPTVLCPVSNDDRPAREEIFGPVACVIPFRDEQEAIGLANDTIYGLSGSIWTRDGAKALRAAEHRTVKADLAALGGSALTDPGEELPIDRDEAELGADRATEPEQPHVAERIVGAVDGDRPLAIVATLDRALHPAGEDRTSGRRRARAAGGRAHPLGHASGPRRAGGCRQVP